jgi:hypothetical protein
MKFKHSFLFPSIFGESKRRSRTTNNTRTWTLAFREFSANNNFIVPSLFSASKTSSQNPKREKNHFYSLNFSKLSCEPNRKSVKESRVEPEGAGTERKNRIVREASLRSGADRSSHWSPARSPLLLLLLFLAPLVRGKRGFSKPFIKGVPGAYNTQLGRVGLKKIKTIFGGIGIKIWAFTWNLVKFNFQNVLF